MIRFHLWKKPKTLKFTYKPQHYDKQLDAIKKRQSGKIEDVKDRLRSSFTNKPKQSTNWHSKNKNLITIISTLMALGIVYLLYVKAEFFLEALLGSN